MSCFDKGQKKTGVKVLRLVILLHPMKKILVPYDFSTQALHAFCTAMDFALQIKAEVHLVNVIELPLMHDTVLMPVLSVEEDFFNSVRETAQNEFTKITEKYKVEGIKVKTEVVFGSMPIMIIDYAEDNQVDLIIMGTKGASGMKEALVGSNTEKVVRHANIPVLAVRNFVKADNIKHIVFPNTLETENQEDLVMKVKALQYFFNAKLHLLWVNTPTNFTRDTITQARLQSFAKRFMFKDFTINIFNDPFEESGIINFAHSIDANMIAMGTHGRKGIAHILGGSLAEDVVNHVDCPIWTYAIKPV